MTIIQGSPEWFAQRLGCATASKFSDVLATVKSGESAARRNYRTQLVLERLTGTVAESFTNGAMEWGTATEPQARAAFELATGLDVQEVGFLKRGDWIGASPDGLIGDDAGLEIKAPNSSTHLETVLAGKMPPGHIAQVQGCMWVTDRARWHFVSYDPRFPQHLRMFHQVIERDEEYIARLADEVGKFLAEVDTAVARLSERAA